jgi:hypothetical protein
MDHNIHNDNVGHRRNGALLASELCVSPTIVEQDPTCDGPERYQNQWFDIQ